VTLPNTEFLQGGIQDFGKTLGAQAIAANPDSCYQHLSPAIG
jgi:hypothetical protein